MRSIIVIIVICSVTLASTAAVRAMQHRDAAGAHFGQTAEQEQTLPGGFGAAAVGRGRELHVAQCGFCHGVTARGGAGGPDLTRSALVQEDDGGKQLGAFLKVGRPDRGMPPFDLTEEQNSDLAAFLHSEIYLAANRSHYKVLDILTGDPKAGEAYFNAAGKCVTCHSVSGDLKGVGTKYDPPTLQGRILNPRQRQRPGSGGPPPQPYLNPNALKATVVLPSGEKATGTLVRLTDFDVTIHDPDTGERRSWLRKDGVPKVAVTDPLQAHVDLWTRLTDEDMHNLTAYLAGLK
jgi:cytochrome c oxidase cbb3-type subunit III